MRRKYGDCERADGDCTQCSLVNYGRDCRDRPISKLEWARLAAGLGQKELAAKSGVNVKYIQNVELGTSWSGNMTAKNLLALAAALGVDARSLL